MQRETKKARGGRVRRARKLGKLLEKPTSGWEKVAGPAYKFLPFTGPTTRLRTVVIGRYKFKLMVWKFSSKKWVWEAARVFKRLRAVQMRGEATLRRLAQQAAVEEAARMVSI